MKTVYHITFKDRNGIRTWQYLDLKEYGLIRKIIDDHGEVKVTKVTITKEDYKLHFNA